jgi:hypothetical protein
MLFSFVGLALAAASILGAEWLLPNRRTKMLVANIVMILVAISYVVMGLTNGAPLQELPLAIFIIAVCVWELLRTKHMSAIILAAMYILHGVFDALHHAGVLGTHIPEFLSGLCITYDVIIAAYIMWLDTKV